MNVIHLRKRVDSETLHIPELRRFLGKNVEIIVLEEKPRTAEIGTEAERYPLRGSILRDEEPFEPVAEEDWEVLQ